PGSRPQAMAWAQARVPGVRRQTKPATPPRREYESSCEVLESAHTLDVGGYVTDLLGQKTPGDGEHHGAGARCRLRAGTGMARAVPSAVELLTEVHRLLRA